MNLCSKSQTKLYGLDKKLNELINLYNNSKYKFGKTGSFAKLNSDGFEHFQFKIKRKRDYRCFEKILLKSRFASLRRGKLDNRTFLQC